MIIATLVLLVGLVIWIAVKLAQAVQREVDKANRDKKKQSAYHALSGLHWLWAGVFGGLKYIYKEWKTAPPDSLEKFGWTMALAAIAALALWGVLKIVDRVVNKEHKPANPPENALTG